MTVQVRDKHNGRYESYYPLPLSFKCPDCGRIGEPELDYSRSSDEFPSYQAEVISLNGFHGFITDKWDVMYYCSDCRVGHIETVQGGPVRPVAYCSDCGGDLEGSCHCPAKVPEYEYNSKGELMYNGVRV